MGAHTAQLWYLNESITFSCQIYLMDTFFGGQFSRYGADVLNVTETAIEQRDDPMNRVFPKVNKFFSSG